MIQKRVICFVDGFNLYHSVKDLELQHLKWLNLRALALALTAPKTEILQDIYYFSAYANHRPDSKKRHIQYVKALTASKVTPVLGNFKRKDKKCPKCNHIWCGHEEKETDVNIALALVDLAYKDKYDHALLISNDSDLAPAIRMVRSNFSNKTITTVVPPNRTHSNELIQASNKKAKITVDQLNRCLLQETFYDVGGNIIAVRPKEYTPPTF